MTKGRLAIILSLAGLLLVALLVGRAVTEREQVLPPTEVSTGGSERSPSRTTVPVRAAQPSETGSWRDTGRRWGIYREDAERFEETEEPMPSTLLTSLAAGPDGRLAATMPAIALPAQIFPQTHPLPSVSPEEPAEPSIRAVQLAAIRYAEVTPQKIRHWRTLAQWRNVIPRFTVSLDRDLDQTIASSTSGGKTTFTVGPEDESLSVDFGLTWDLADLVWDPAQTSIDVRSRLMVQLRQDILEEVTRLYFERKRLQAEFEANPTDDPLLLQERSLRIDELTAQLDAFTGGFYSAAPEE